MMKKKRLFEEGMDKVLVGMNLKEANENEVKMDKTQQCELSNRIEKINSEKLSWKKP